MAVTPNEGERQRTDVAVAIAAGADAWEATQELRGVPGVRVVTTPRHAAVLLVAGTVDDEDREPLLRVPAQLPHPRAVVAWRPAGAARDVPAQVVDEDLDAVIAQVHRARSGVIAEPSRGARDLLPDTEPNEWRGVGPFGQGGEGMMGGTPYGRPMTMTGDDRDGLGIPADPSARVPAGAFGHRHPRPQRGMLLGPRPARARRLGAPPATLAPHQPGAPPERRDVAHHHGRPSLAVRAHPTRATPVPVGRGLHGQLDLTVDVTRGEHMHAVDAEHDNSSRTTLRWHLELSFSQSQNNREFRRASGAHRATPTSSPITPRSPLRDEEPDTSSRL